MAAFWIVPLPKPNKHGRRARRQSFYDRARTARLLTRIARQLEAESSPAIERAMLDCITRGMGVAEVQWDRGDGEGFTSEPLRNGEWPKAMLRTRHVPFAEFMAPWPAVWPPQTP